MNPLVRAAFIWYYAEFPNNREVAESDLLAVAMPRVDAVFSGEIRWSEASAGDRAIWVGRPRDIATFNDGSHRVGSRWENFWDTEIVGPGDVEALWGVCRPCSCCGPAGSVRLFGCANIGNWWLCNMMVGGQLPGDSWFDIRQMYIDCDRHLSPKEIVTASLQIQRRQVASARFNDLVLGHPVGAQVPPRGDFYVELHWNALEKPIRVTLHLEGVSYPW